MFSLIPAFKIRFTPPAVFLLDSLKLLIVIKWGFHHHNELLEGRCVNIGTLSAGAAAFMEGGNIKYLYFGKVNS